jgi:hypothetical protein
MQMRPVGDLSVSETTTNVFILSESTPNNDVKKRLIDFANWRMVYITFLFCQENKKISMQKLSLVSRLTSRFGI